MRKVFSIVLASLILLTAFLACDSGSSQPTLNPTPTHCISQYIFDHTTDGGHHEMVVINRQAAANYNLFTETEKLTASSGATVSLTVTSKTKADVQIGSGADGVVLNVSQEYDVSATASLTATVGNEVDITIPAMSEEHGNYGVFVQIVTGHLYQSCGGKDFGTVTSYTPVNVGWCTWTESLKNITQAIAETNTPVCPEAP